MSCCAGPGTCLVVLNGRLQHNGRTGYVPSFRFNREQSINQKLYMGGWEGSLTLVDRSGWKNKAVRVYECVHTVDNSG